jgi:hypothetical protein
MRIDMNSPEPTKEYMMHSLRHEIAQAQANLKLPDAQFHELPKDYVVPVYRHAEAQFAKQLPSWWWMRLRCRGYAMSVRPDTPEIKLSDFINVPGPVYLMIDADDGKLVYEGTVLGIEQIISECSYFEYYVVAKNFKWLMCETHHGEFIAVGFRAIRWLKQYVIAHNEYVHHVYAVVVRSF